MSVSRVTFEVPQEFGTLLLNYKEPASKQKADALFNQLFSLDQLLDDRKNQLTFSELKKCITNLSTSLQAFDGVHTVGGFKATALNVASRIERFIPLDKIVSQETRNAVTLHDDKAYLKTLLDKAKTQEAALEKEMAIAVTRQQTLSVKKREVTLEMLQGSINSSIFKIAGGTPESLEELFVQLLSMTGEEADATTRVKTFEKEGVIIPKGLSGKDLELLKAASETHFDAVGQTFTSHCQRYTHKDKTPFFTPYENEQKRQVVIADEKVVHETEFTLKRRTDGLAFATVQARLLDGRCLFSHINLLVQTKPDCEKLNRAFSETAKVEKASGSSVEA